MATERKSEGKGLAQRVGRLEREVKQMQRTTPVPAQNQASARAADIAATLTRLQGQPREDLTSDAERGAASQLGFGTGERKRR
jgi:hypothetical protein